MGLFKRLLPKHTILGKLARGNTKGALSSAQNYVKSGELMTDIGNISTMNIGGIVRKSGVVKDLPRLVGALTNKKPSPAQKSGNLSGGTSSATQTTPTPSVYSAVESSPSQNTGNDTTSSDTPKPDDNKMFIYIGAAALLLFLMNKK